MIVERPSRRLPAAAARLLLAASLGATASHAAEVAHLPGGGVLPEGLPFSAAVRVDDTVYLSGQIGVEPGTLTLVEGGMTAQARQTMENIKATLQANGLDMDDVVKCTVMLADMGQWGAFNEVYRTYFTPPYPARSALGANGLALGGLLEVECMAVVGNRRPQPEAPPEPPPSPGSAPDDERTYRRPSAG